MRIPTALTLVLALSGLQTMAKTSDEVTTGLIKDAQQAVRHDMRDPDSAQFRDLRHFKMGKSEKPMDVICGEVNGKNAYGAYAGFRRFFVIAGAVTMDNSDTAMVFGTMWKTFCTAAEDNVLQPVPVPASGKKGA